MRKILLFILLYLSIFSLKAQETLNYEGVFDNGLNVKGTARFKYYEGEKGAKIKHGSFRYYVRERNEDSRLNHNFSGEYQHGLKDGSWDYQVKSRNYDKDAEGFYYTKEISLKASYSKGMPNGKWVYNANVSKRKLFRKEGREKWGQQIQVKNIQIILSFNIGILVDTLQIKDRLGDDLIYTLDKKGFMHGQSQIRLNKSLSTCTYQHGLQVKVNTKENEDYNFYLSHKDKPGFCFNLKTISLLSSTNDLYKYLIDNVFNPEYFLFSSIDGDKSVALDRLGRVTKLLIQGATEKSIEACVNKKQQDYISGIYYSFNTIRDKRKSLEKQIKTNQDQSLSGKLVQMKQLEEKSEKYYEVAQQAKKEFRLEILKQNLKAQIGEVPESVRKAKSMDLFLSACLSEVKVLKNAADKLSK